MSVEIDLMRQSANIFSRLDSRLESAFESTVSISLIRYPPCWRSDWFAGHAGARSESADRSYRRLRSCLRFDGMGIELFGAIADVVPSRLFGYELMKLVSKIELVIETICGDREIFLGRFNLA